MGQLEKESRLRGRAGVEGEPCVTAEDRGCVHAAGGTTEGLWGRPVRSHPSWPAVSSCLRPSVIAARLEGRSWALKEEPPGWGPALGRALAPEFPCEGLPSVPVPETRVSGLRLAFRPSPR